MQNLTFRAFCRTFNYSSPELFTSFKICDASDTKRELRERGGHGGGSGQHSPRAGKAVLRGTPNSCSPTPRGTPRPYSAARMADRSVVHPAGMCTWATSSSLPDVHWACFGTSGGTAGSLSFSSVTLVGDDLPTAACIKDR